MPDLHGQLATKPAQARHQMSREPAVEVAARRDHDPAELADGRQNPRRIVESVRQGGAELGGKRHAAIVAAASS